VTVRVRPQTESPYCPKCGGRMVRRDPKEGQEWPAFWGCSQFPDCNGTREIDQRTEKAIIDDNPWPPRWHEDYEHIPAPIDIDDVPF
jgi:ssDNA-binding Zn-finger/Zn-ribbon topoisomerase 1